MPKGSKLACDVLDAALLRVSAGSASMDQITDRGLGQQLISSVLTTGAVRYADREALFCSGTGRRFTFRELNVRSNRLAHVFSARAFRRGDVVGFLCSNRAEIVEI